MFKVKRYTGKIASGSGLYESSRGTLGFQVLIHCEEEGANIDYTIWLTDATRERAEKDFQTLGVSPSEIKDAAFYSRIGQEIEGREISFGTGEETYNDKTTIKVKWISPKKDPGTGTLEERAAALFLGKTNATTKSASGEDDSDLPF